MAQKSMSEMRLWDEVPGYDLREDVDLPELHSWFLDGTHSVPPWTPLFGYYWIRFCSHGLKACASQFSIPTSKGWEMRYKDGGSYNAFIIVRDQKEIEDRQAVFRSALKPWIEDFDGLWAAGKRELLQMYDKLKELDVDHASNLQLYSHNYDLINTYRRMWEIHFEGMYSSMFAWLLLEGLCKERFGMRDQDPEFQDMLRGFDNKAYEMDRKIWEFAQLAKDMGIQGILVDNESGSIVPKLQETEKGKEWFKQFTTYLESDDVGGWRMRRMNDLTEPYWLEDPETPIGVMKHHLRKGTEDVQGKVTGQLSRKRDEAIESFLQKVPPPERPMFKGLIDLAGKAGSYSEEHDLYCELISHSLMRRGYLAMGRRLASAGTIDKPSDVFMLNPDEIDRVMMVPEHHDLRFITRRRRASWEEWQKRPNPPVITDRASLEEAVVNDLLPSGDPIAIKLVVGELPEPKPELGADMFGTCGCPGEAEGKARLVLTYEDLKAVQPGEIIVCPGTNPAWTPVFGIVNAVITDRGGTLSHAAIVGREYAVPTIVNTFEATAKIKTGQRLRVNAKEGAIYFLDK
jgi:pyruvate,water dikinase